jgi:D-threo-aldose 1-dehydrogenase
MTTSESSTLPLHTLGRTGIGVSALSLGTWGFGDASAPQARIGDDENLCAVLRMAFAAGVRLLDSADAYANENRLGRLLRQVDAPADLVIATKFGHGKGFSADQFTASVERSLKDLGLEKIELMMVHDPRDEADMKTVLGKGGALEALRKLQDQGLVGSVGVATGTLRPLELAVDTDEFDVIQFPRLYTLINRAAKSSGLLAAAREKNIGTLCAAPFAGNVLATGTRGVEQPLYAYWPAQPEVVAAVQRMQERAEVLGLTLAQAALAFTTTEPLVHSSVVGVTSPAELEQNLAAVGVSVSREDLESIAETGTVDDYLLGGPDFIWPFPADRKPAGIG